MPSHFAKSLLPKATWGTFIKGTGEVLGIFLLPPVLLAGFPIQGGFKAAGRAAILRGGGLRPRQGQIEDPYLVPAASGVFLLNPGFFIFLSSSLTSPELEKAENETLAMRKQSEGLTKEYDRLLEEHTRLQVSMPWPALLDARPPFPLPACPCALGRPPGEASTLLL